MQYLMTYTENVCNHSQSAIIPYYLGQQIMCVDPSLDP